MSQKHSQMDQILEAFRILHPQEPLDAKTLADLTDLTPKQASTALSRLHQTGYLVRVGSSNRFALYLPTRKPMRKKGSTIQKEYRTRLRKRNQQNHTNSQEQDAKRILKAIARAIERELERQPKSLISADITRQLTLFCR